MPPLADGLGRLQALHPRRLPGRLPDRCAVPHRVRHRRRAGGRLQRLRVLHPRLPVRGDRPAQGRRPGVEVHAVLRPAGRRHEPACAKACPTESIQFGPLDELRERAAARLDAAARRGRRRGAAVRRGPAATASAATARSSCCSTSRRCTGCRRTRSSPPATCRPCGGTPVRPPPGWRPPPPRPSPRQRLGRAQVSSRRSPGGPARRAAGPGGQPPASRRGRAGAAAGAGAASEQPMVPPAEFTSYYGKPVINSPVWRSPDIPGYFFLGGLAGASSLLAAGAQADRPARAGPRGQGRRARRDQPVHGRAGARPRPARPVPQHAAGVQGDLADERGLVDPVRLRPGRRCRRGSRADRPRAPARGGGDRWRRRCSARPSPPTPRC